LGIVNYFGHFNFIGIAASSEVWQDLVLFHLQNLIMKKSITITDLDKLSNNYRNNKDIRSITNAAFIKIKELQDFIDEAKQKHGNKFDTLQINFIRYNLAKDEKDRILTAGNGLSQVSLIFVAVRTIEAKNWTVEKLKDDSDNVFTLSINEPEGNDPQGAGDPVDGLCPPKEGCQS
jgi:hypothetical protein